MAPRVGDYPPDEEWPDLEDELAPVTFPMGGAYAGALEHLHGARLTLDAGLIGPTMLLAAAAARRALAVARAEARPPSPPEAAHLAKIGEGSIPPTADGVLDALTELAVFIERRAAAPKR